MGKVHNIYRSVFRLETSKHDSLSTTLSVLDEDPTCGSKLPKVAEFIHERYMSVSPACSSQGQILPWHHLHNTDFTVFELFSKLM